MKAAGLKAIDTVVSSTAVLVKSKNPTNPALVDLIASRILGVISKVPFPPRLFKADILQWHKNMSSANTMSNAQSLHKPLKSRPGSGHPLSTLWKKRDG